MEKPPVSLALEKLNIPHRVFIHQTSIRSLEEAANARNQRPSQIVRSILFRVGENDYVMALVAGPQQISWKALRKYLGQSRLTLATEEEVLSVTGYRVGAVGPLGLPQPLRVLVEAGVLDEAEISIGSGMPNTAVVLASQDLLRALNNPEVVQLAGL
ncbi:MAG: YbaK/EbsC family protein [Anaerolineales bacterium]|nr:YbaK/EbsC family protein [Anaerolineales bacterium]MCZ2122464.1 YbaK/EbsC family protein [Anaerolineales bacterium]